MPFHERSHVPPCPARRSLLPAGPSPPGHGQRDRADEIRLTAPIAAGTLAEEGIDLVANFTLAEDGAFVVTATWVSEGDATASRRLVMRLQPGEGTTFSLPRHEETAFFFSRTGDGVSIISAPAPAWKRTASL